MRAFWCELRRWEGTEYKRLTVEVQARGWNDAWGESERTHKGWRCVSVWGVKPA